MTRPASINAARYTLPAATLLSTWPAGPGQRRFALVVVLVSAAFFAVAAPFAKQALPQVWAFIPIYESALIVNDLITAILLFGQFRIARSRAMLVLASGYVFTACITVAHALTFPGLFAPGGLIGAGPQSTAWLYMFWHVGFPSFVVAYTLLDGGAREAMPTAPAAAVSLQGPLQRRALSCLPARCSPPAVMTHCRPSWRATATRQPRSGSYPRSGWPVGSHWFFCGGDGLTRCSTCG